MLLEYMRVLLDTGTISDKSLENQDDSINTTIALTTTSYIYIAQRYPFTSLFFHSHVANAVVSNLSAEYWDGTQWRAAVDMLDGTSTGGATLAKSGNIRFSLNDDYNWQRVYDTSDAEAPDELATFNIYNCYWLRLKVSANLTGTTALKVITYAFTHSQQLKTVDYEIDSYMPSIESGKTDWNREIIAASKLVLADLKNRKLVVAPGQIMDLDEFHVPTSLRAVELIYSYLGPSYDERAAKKHAEYLEAFNGSRFTIDSNADGKLESSEISRPVRRVTR